MGENAPDKHDTKMYRYNRKLLAIQGSLLFGGSVWIILTRGGVIKIGSNTLDLVKIGFLLYAIYHTILTFRIRVYLDDEGIKRITRKRKEWRSISWDRIKSIQLGDSSRMVKFCFWVRDEKQDIAFSDWYEDHIELSERIIEECQKRNPDAQIDPALVERLKEIEQEKAAGQNLRLEEAKSKKLKAYRYRKSVITKELLLYVFALCCFLLPGILLYFFRAPLNIWILFVILIIFGGYALYIKIEETAWNRIYVNEEGMRKVQGKRVEWYIPWDSITGMKVGARDKAFKSSFWIERGILVTRIDDRYADYIELSERIIEEYQKRDPDAKIDPQIIRELEQIKAMEK